MGTLATQSISRADRLALHDLDQPKVVRLLKPSLGQMSLTPSPTTGSSCYRLQVNTDKVLRLDRKASPFPFGSID